MTQIIQSHGKIQTLNMDPSEYESVFNALAPAEKTMAVYSYCGAAKYDEGEADAFRKTIASTVKVFEQTSSAKNLKVRVIELTHARDLLLAHAITKAISHKSNYCHCFPTVAFYDHHLVDSYPAKHYEPHHALHAAMSLLDDQYERTGSMEPALHVPVPVDEKIARTYRLIVGGVFQEKVGLWCRHLVEPRSRFMVMYYALEHGRSPEDEWQRFVREGGQHHFDYLQFD